MLTELFPEPQAEPRAEPQAEREPQAAAPVRPARRLVVAACYSLAVLGGAALMLLRYVGNPPWRTIYAEDLPVYLGESLIHPWRIVFASYAGYEQLVPRLIGQLVSLLPLKDAAAAFAIIGALVAAGCAVFVFHASSGHVRSSTLRVLLGLSVLLLPVALLQISDSGVNTPWYLEMALFWALLWRPPTRAGLALAGLIGFAAAASNITAAVFGILVVLRVIALPRVREQMISLGWLAGCLTQIPYVLESGRAGKLATAGQSVSFYGHDVVLPAFGWQVSWVLRHWWDRNYALIAVGTVLALIVAVILATGPVRIQLFTVTALGFGFVFTVFAASVSWWVTTGPVRPASEPGARYSCLPILLITWVLILAVDHRADSKAGSRASSEAARRASVLATLALTGVLCVGWIPDFAYAGDRVTAPVWAPVLQQWQRTCQQQTAIRYWDEFRDAHLLVIPCDRVR